MTDDEIDFEFESQKLLRGLEKELEQVEAEFSIEQERYNEIERQEKELRDKLAELAKQKSEFQGTIFDKRVRIRRIRNEEIPAQQQKIRIARNNAEQKRALEKKQARFDEISRNAHWRKSIFTHQLDGAYFMASAERCVVADAMGTGKTIETIAALDMVEAKRVLVICPGDIMGSFHNEFRKWAPSRNVTVLGRKTKAEQQFLLDILATTVDEFTVIINYQTWYKNKKIWNWLLNCEFDTVIVDEAHSIKEIKGMPYRGTFKITMSPNHCDNCNTKLTYNEDRDTWFCMTCRTGNYSSSVKRFFALTGTPILNKPSEIYPLLHIAQPEVFGSKMDFRREFTREDAEGKEIWTIDGQARLAEKISGMYIRRTLRDTGIELPPQEEIIHEVTIDPNEYELQYSFLKQLFSDALIQIEDGRAATTTSLLSLITRQRQGTVWPGGVWMNIPKLDEEGNPVFIEDANGDMIMEVERVHVGKDYQQSAKMDKAVELYHELADGGHRVIFFSQFKEVLKELKHRIGDEIAEFHGDVNEAQRELVKNNFDASKGEEPKWQGMVAHYGVGGVGVTFTAATAIIIMDEEWNQGKSNQAYDRIHRIGQTKETQVHILRHTVNDDTNVDSEGKKLPSIDDWMVALRERKEGVVSGFNMSIEELKKAFMGDDKK